MIAFCQNQQRRELVLQTPGVNGLDYLEVLGPTGCGSQLALTFLKNAQGLALAAGLPGLGFRCRAPRRRSSS